MFGYHEFSLELLQNRPWLVALAAVVLLALAFRLYRRTNPPLTLPWRVLLFLLRSIAVLSLIAALMQPVLHYQRRYERSKRLAVLLDQSKSMDKQEQGMSRAQRLDSVLSGSTFRRLKKDAVVHRYYFSDSLSTNRSKIDADRTAIGDVLAQAVNREQEEPPDVWLLFSDGRSNAGSDPATVAGTLNRPVVCTNMASDTGNFDIALDDLEYKPVVFAGRRTDIRVRLKWQQADSQKVLVQLYRGTALLQRRRYTLEQQDGFGEVTLRYIPNRPGKEMLSIRLPESESETNIHNNERTIAVNVLKSRLSVLLWTSHPDYEVGFLRRFLLQSDRYDVQLFVDAPRGGNLTRKFPAQQAELNRYDLVILYDPDPVTLGAVRSELKSYLEDRGGGVLVLLGRSFAARGPVDWFDRLLPFSQSSRRTVENLSFHGQPVEGQLFHPAVRLADNRAAIRDAWTTVPPFESLVRCDLTDSAAVILVQAGSPASLRANVPILGYRRHGRGKLLALAALPLWQWRFMAPGYGGDTDRYDRILNGIIAWLTAPEESEPVRITPLKDVFTRGETVRFDGLAFDQGYRPLENVTGTISLKSKEGNDVFETDFLALGEGRYRADFNQLPPGEYSFNGVLSKEGSTLAEKTGRIQIESFSLEEADQSGDPNALRAIARQSSGAYLPWQQFDKVLNRLDLSSVAVEKKGEVVAWGQGWLLGLFLSVLAVDWAVRKFNHLL